MFLMKIALTVLGTVGLAAGTVLAVAEPTPSPLPETTTVARGGCPSRACGTAKCSAGAISACAASEKTCTADAGACDTKCSQKTASCQENEKVVYDVDSYRAGTVVGIAAKATCQKSKAAIDGPPCPGCETLVDTAVSVALRKSTVATVVNSCGLLVSAASHVDCGKTAQACGERASECGGAASQCAAGQADANSACARERCDGESPEKTVVGVGVNSNAGVVGNIVLSENGFGLCEAKEVHTGLMGPAFGSPVATVLSAACCDAAAECCADGTCVAAGNCSTSECKEQKKHRVRISLGITSEGPTIRLTSGTDASECPNGSCESECPKNVCRTIECEKAACAAKACNEGGCPGTCAKTCDVAVTACEAKPACAEAVCPVAVCAPACDESECPDAACSASKCEPCSNKDHTIDEDLVSDVVEAESADSIDACDCRECCCEACVCETDAECPPGMICPVATPIGEPHAFRGAGANFRWTRTRGFHGVPDVSGLEQVVRHYDSYRHGPAAREPGDAPGRVRLTHLPGLRFMPAASEVMPPAYIAFTSFADPTAASAPAPAPAVAGRPIEGTWIRRVGSCTVTLTVERGRFQGAWANDEEQASVDFSGTCSVSEDGQLFGVIDEVDLAAEGEVMAQRSIASKLVDQPFAFRFRLDEEDLIVKDFRCAGLGASVEHAGTRHGLADYVGLFACGRFERSE